MHENEILFRKSWKVQFSTFFCCLKHSKHFRKLLNTVLTIIDSHPDTSQITSGFQCFVFDHDGFGFGFIGLVFLFSVV